MKVLFLAIALAAPSSGQPADGPFTGAWTAEFAGRTFIRLELETVNGTIAGGISLGNFELDAQGAVRRADEASPNLKPIVDVTRRGSIVTFFLKDGDSTDQFSLVVLDAGGVDLQLLLNDEDREELAASGVPIPKPIRLRKAG